MNLYMKKILAQQNIDRIESGVITMDEIRKYLDDKGNSARQITKYYNYVFHTNSPVTTCGSCIIRKRNELIDFFRELDKKEQDVQKTEVFTNNEQPVVDTPVLDEQTLDLSNLGEVEQQAVIEALADSGLVNVEVEGKVVASKNKNKKTTETRSKKKK